MSEIGIWFYGKLFYDLINDKFFFFNLFIYLFIYFFIYLFFFF